MSRKDKSFKELGEKAHFLKGSALALGCERLGHICETLQHLKAPDDEQLEVIDMCLIEVSCGEIWYYCRAIALRFLKVTSVHACRVFS